VGWKNEKGSEILNDREGRGGEEADKKRQVVVKEMGQRQWLEKGPKIDRRMEGVLIIHTNGKDRCVLQLSHNQIMLLSFLISLF
jgi:hypothetical protein